MATLMARLFEGFGRLVKVIGNTHGATFRKTVDATLLTTGASRFRTKLLARF